MKVCLVHLELLMEEALLGLEPFLERYPGAFLVAGGILELDDEPAEAGPQGAENRPTDKLGQVRRDPTARRLDFTPVFGVAARPHFLLDQPHALAGTAFHLRPDEEKRHVVVGRGATCDITVPDRSVSETHCRIEVTDGGVTAVDLASTNGTRVNEDRLAPYKPAVLADEDILTVGRCVFQLFSSATLYAGLTEAQRRART